MALQSREIDLHQSQDALYTGIIGVCILRWLSGPAPGACSLSAGIWRAGVPAQLRLRRDAVEECPDSLVAGETGSAAAIE